MHYTEDLVKPIEGLNLPRTLLLKFILYHDYGIHMTYDGHNYAIEPSTLHPTSSKLVSDKLDIWLHLNGYRNLRGPHPRPVPNVTNRSPGSEKQEWQTVQHIEK